MSETINLANRGIWQWAPRDGSVVYDINLADVPDHVILEAAKRGLAHVLSNEAASKAVEAMDKMENITDRDATRAELLNEYRLDYIDTFMNGSWGTGRRGPSGPRVDALTTEYQRLLAKEVRQAMASAKMKYSKDEKLWFIMSGDRRITRTLEQACDGYLSKNPGKHDALMAQAQETVDFKKRQAELKQAAPAVAPVVEEDGLAF